MDAQVRHVSYALSEVVDLKCGVSPSFVIHPHVIYLWGFRNPIMRIVSGSDRVEYIFLNINTRLLLTHNYGSRHVFSCSRSPCMCDATAAAGCCCTLITKGSAVSSCDHVSEEVLLSEWVLAIANCAAAQITLREQAVITIEAKHEGRGGTLLRGSWELLASLEVGGVGLQLGQRLLRLGLVLRLRVHSFIRPPSTTKHLQPMPWPYRGGRERLQLCALGQLLCDEARERVRAGLLLLLLLLLGQGLGWLEGRRPVEARALWRSGDLPKVREPTGQLREMKMKRMQSS
jgi:hypothetical protein